MFRRAPKFRLHPTPVAALGFILLAVAAGLLVRRFAAGRTPTNRGTSPLPRRKALTAPTRASLRQTKEALRRTRAAAVQNRPPIRRSKPDG